MLGTVLTAIGGGARSALGQISWPYRIAIVATAVGVFGGWCYMRGAQAAEQEHFEQLNASLKAQLERTQALAERDLEAAVELTDEESRLVTDISQVNRAGSLCDRNGVRDYRAAVRIASGAGSVDAAAAGTD